MRTRTGPSSVGTSTRAPSAASCTATGSVRYRSRPTRRRNGWSPTSTVTYRSPLGPPRAPACPRPGTATRAPPSMPGGSATRYNLAPRLHAHARARATPLGRQATAAVAAFARRREDHVAARPSPRALSAAAWARRPRGAARGRRRRTPDSAPACAPDTGNGPPRTASVNDSRQRDLDVGAARRRRRLPRGILKDVRRRTRRRSPQVAPPPASRSRIPRTRPPPRPGRGVRRRAAVVFAAPLEVGQHAVGVLNLAVHFLRHAIARIHARVIPTRQPAIRALDLVGRRRAAQPEQGVKIHSRQRFGERAARPLTHPPALLLFFHDFRVDHVVHVGGLAVSAARARRSGLGTCPAGCARTRRLVQVLARCLLRLISASSVRAMALPSLVSSAFLTIVGRRLRSRPDRPERACRRTP